MNKLSMNTSTVDRKVGLLFRRVNGGPVIDKQIYQFLQVRRVRGEPPPEVLKFANGILWQSM